VKLSIVPDTQVITSFTVCSKKKVFHNFYDTQEFGAFQRIEGKFIKIIIVLI